MIKKELTMLGCFFIAIATFLYATKHLTAAIMTAHINNADVNYFGGGYASIGSGITFWTGLSFLVGMVLVISGLWSLVQEVLVRRKKELIKLFTEKKDQKSV